ncbi:germinal-center associated nuclear protein isoform X2 [Prorops nasuta]|uniref:germinal-center associated nuclear protein isoform X2 n=1 Tax=Prorops nasuta TaxID=863751 RepID=UPI0034CF611E
MSDYIEGTCFLMCPDKERNMRQREGMLHRFEIDENGQFFGKPKADPGKAIKSFSRPAAGQFKADPAQLRPAPVLLKTIKYLFTNIATRLDTDWIHIYDFIFDRLRSVRQDITIQRLKPKETIQLLEPIVRFHVYANQRLYERQISEFDVTINNQHLLECLKQLLVLYDYKDEGEFFDLNNSDVISGLLNNLVLENNRPEMEAIYLLVNIGDSTALTRAVTLSREIRNNINFKIAMKTSLAWYKKNYISTFRLMQKLPPLLICAALINLRQIRRDALEIMSVGYSSTVQHYPIKRLQQLLLYQDIRFLKLDCSLFNLPFTSETVNFQKKLFKSTERLAYAEMFYSLENLHEFLPEILLP